MENSNELEIDYLAEFREELSERLDVAQQLITTVPESLQSAAFRHVLDALANRSDGKGSKESAKNPRAAKQSLATGESAQKRPRTALKNGPMELVAKLLDGGFFSTRRKVAEVVTEIKDRHGRTVPSADMSKILLRLLQSGRLRRVKTGENLYEYENNA